MRTEIRWKKAALSIIAWLKRNLATHYHYHHYHYYLQVLCNATSSHQNSTVSDYMHHSNSNIWRCTRTILIIIPVSCLSQYTFTEENFLPQSADQKKMTDKFPLNILKKCVSLGTRTNQLDFWGEGGRGSNLTQDNASRWMLILAYYHNGSTNP